MCRALARGVPFVDGRIRPPSGPSTSPTFTWLLDADPESLDPGELFIDVLIGLPELVDGTATPETIAPFFRHMRIERPGETPVCRLRLEARWE
jgi:hypothetical protein